MASRVRAGYWVCGSYFLPVAQIPSQYFTHLYAGFAKVHPDGRVTLPDDIPDQYLEQFRNFNRAFSARASQVQTLLSIGGENSDCISSVLSDQSKRNIFIRDSISLAKDYGFDGLDLCWLYPSSTDKGDDLTLFLTEWRNAVREDARQGNNRELLLTAVVFHHPVIPCQHGSFFYYPCQALKDNLDWINVLAIDFYTPSNSPGRTGPVHAWLNTIEPDKCGSAGIGNWINNGVPTRKLVLSLPFFGYEWSLTAPPDQSEFFAPANAANAISIPYRTIKGIVGDRRNNYENGSYDKTYVATYSKNNGGSWIAYDDKRSISSKVRVAANYGGCFAWTLGGDDDDWTLSRAAFEESLPAETYPS